MEKSEGLCKYGAPTGVVRNPQDEFLSARCRSACAITARSIAITTRMHHALVAPLSIYHPRRIDMPKTGNQEQGFA